MPMGITSLKLWGAPATLASPCVPPAGFVFGTTRPPALPEKPPSWGQAHLCPGTPLAPTPPRRGLRYKLKFNFIKPVSNQSQALANNAGQGASASSMAVIHPTSPALVRKLLEQHFPPKFMALAASGA